MTTIEFVTGDFLITSEYGTVGANYGDGTYGQRESDTQVGLRFRAYGVPIGYPRARTWQYRVNDHGETCRAAIANDEGTPLPTIGTTATMHLDRYGPTPHRIELPLTVLADYYQRVLQQGDLDEPGEYRMSIEVFLASGRRLTVPVGDSVTFSVVEVAE